MTQFPLTLSRLSFSCYSPTYLLLVLGPLVLGVVPSLLVTRPSRNWRLTLIKSRLSVSYSLQAVIWILNYLSMGHASYLIYISAHPFRHVALGLYAAQLALNVGWMVLCLGFCRVDWGLTCTAMLAVAVTGCVGVFEQVSVDAAVALTGTLVWTFHCLYLNTFLVVHNGRGRVKKRKVLRDEW